MQVNYLQNKIGQILIIEIKKKLFVMSIVLGCDDSNSLLYSPA